MVGNVELNALLQAAPSLKTEIKLSDSEKRLMKHFQIKVMAYKKFTESALNKGFADLSHTEFDEYCYEDLELKNELLRIENKLKTRLYHKAKLQHEFVEKLNQYTSALSDAASYLEGQIVGRDTQKSSFSNKGGKARATKDPKQAEKKIVKECWEAWQSKPEQYTKKIKFATAMVDKFRPDDPDEESKHLCSTAKIVQWCGIWEREKHTQLAK